jgi:hypothetical protein
VLKDGVLTGGTPTGGTFIAGTATGGTFTAGTLTGGTFTAGTLTGGTLSGGMVSVGALTSGIATAGAFSDGSVAAPLETTSIANIESNTTESAVPSWKRRNTKFLAIMEWVLPFSSQSTPWLPVQQRPSMAQEGERPHTAARLAEKAARS